MVNYLVGGGGLTHQPQLENNKASRSYGFNQPLISIYQQTKSIGGSNSLHILQMGLPNQSSKKYYFWDGENFSSQFIYYFLNLSVHHFFFSSLLTKLFHSLLHMIHAKNKIPLTGFSGCLYMCYLNMSISNTFIS